MRFEATDRRIGSALGPLLDTAAGHPQRTMLLAHVLWGLTAEGETASEETWLATHDRVMRDVRDELRAVWSALAPSQRRVLTAVAEGREGIYAAGRRHGGSRGGAAASATEALVSRGEITEDPSTASDQSQDSTPDGAIGHHSALPVRPSVHRYAQSS